MIGTHDVVSTSPPPTTRMSGFLECEIAKDGSIRFPDLHCPIGHRIPWEAAFHEAGYPKCGHREKNGAPACNARLFIHFFPRVSSRMPPMLFVAEVSYDEIKHITKAGLDVPQIYEYLGVRWAPPRIRVQYVNPDNP